MEVIAIIALIVIFSVADYFIYLKIKEKFQTKSSILSKELEKKIMEYEKLSQEIKGLKRELQELEAKYVRIKNREVDKIREKQSSKPTATEVLLSENLVNAEDIKKAKEFIKNNNSPFSILDVLVLLGRLDIKDANYVKSKISRED